MKSKQELEIERLQEIIDDYRQGIEKVLDDRCPSDERHCGCVPILRNKIDFYENAFLMIVGFPGSRAITYNEKIMQEIASDALGFRRSGKVDAIKYWVDKFSELQKEYFALQRELSTIKNESGRNE